MKLHLTIGLTALLLVGCSSAPQADPATETSAATEVSQEPTITETPVLSEPKPLPVESVATPDAVATTEPIPEVTLEPAPPAEPNPEDAALESALAEALTQPDQTAKVNPLDSPEDQYLDAFRQEIAVMPDGPYAPIEDIEALTIGYRACVALEDYGYADALLAYAFSEESTEESVANYKAALNAAPSTICE